MTIIVEVVLGDTLESLKTSASWLHFLLSHAFILGYDSLPLKPMVPAWSLDFEMQFYILAPLLVIFMLRSARPLLFLGIGGLVSLASSLWLGPHILTSYLVFFLVGIVVADDNWQLSGKSALGAFVLAFILLAACLLSPYRGVLLVGAHPGPLAIYNQQVNVAVALLMTPYAIYTTRQIGFALDGMFADLSYIVYLLHWGGVLLISRYESFAIPRLVFVAIVWTAVYGLAFVIWKVYDRPINQARSKWVSSRKLRESRSIKAIEAEAVP